MRGRLGPWLSLVCRGSVRMVVKGAPCSASTVHGMESTLSQGCDSHALDALLLNGPQTGGRLVVRYPRVASVWGRSALARLAASGEA